MWVWSTHHNTCTCTCISQNPKGGTFLEFSDGWKEVVGGGSICGCGQPIIIHVHVHVYHKIQKEVPFWNLVMVGKK